MKRFVKVMALFAVFAFFLFVFDKLQPGIRPGGISGITAPISGYAVYEERQLQWALDDASDYSYDETLINLSNEEAKLRPQKVLKEIKSASEVKLPLKKEDDDDKKSNKTEYKKKYDFNSESYSYSESLKNLYFEAETPPKTSIKFKLRTAETQEGLKKADWLGPQGKEGKDYYITTGQAISDKHGKSGYVQYKAVLETDDDLKTPTLNSVTITYETVEYPAEAAISTKDYVFGRSAEVQALTTEEELRGQAIKYEYSTDSGNTWKEPVSGQILAAAADKIAVKATLGSNGAETPVVKDIKLSYRISICDELWQVNYTSCGKSDTRIKYYSDANSCGSTEDLPADNGTAESCDYCTSQWINVNSSCRNDDTTAVNYIYTNTCCQETGLASDCTIPQNTTTACDYCTPNWQETKGSCGTNDRVTATYSDANNCYETTGLQSDSNKPANKTYTCDYCAPSFVCGSYGDCGEDNKKACTQVNDSSSCYGKTGLASDNYTGNYGEFAASCIYDSESPVISNVTATVSGSALTITASITDKSATTATARVIKDDAAVMNITLANTTAGTFIGTANASALKGAYIVTIVAKDKYGNTQRAKGIAGFATLSDKTTVREFALNGTTKALLKLTNTTQIELAGKASADIQDVRIVLSEHAKDILNTTKPTGKRELQKYVEVEADEGLKSNVSSATLKISYTDEEAAAANVSETSLAVYYYNETFLLWQLLNSAVNTLLNYVEGNTTHLSLFGVFGNVQNLTQNQTSPAVNATINETSPANNTAANNTATNATANQTAPGGGEQQQQQETLTEPNAAATAGGGGGTAEKTKESAAKHAQEEKDAGTTAELDEAGESCTYDVRLELASNPSFINKTRTNATLTNTGTCELQNIEIKATPPLDAYIVIENGKKAGLKPLESFGFAIKLKAAAEAELQAQQQKQPVQGFVVKEPRKAATRSGKILITWQGVKGPGLNEESGEVQLKEEVPLNIEIYELEQNGNKGSIAATAIGILVLIALLGMLYSRITRGRKERGNGNKGTDEINEPAAKIGEEKAAAEKPQQEQPHEYEKETPGFEEGLKRFEEKWKQQQDQQQQTGQQNQQEKGLEGFRETFK
ncbi:hypothetical protein HYV85_04585 [Candidatus Woesearchaeota archaeon]|nr:hypothetical protein [Candidatus Woesearchaeota archaeon]